MLGTRTHRMIASAIACVTVGVGAVALQAGAADGDEASSFVATAPCRLFDFRPEFDFGPRNSALGADESHIVKVTGDEGDCVGIPADATGVAMNLTGVGPTSATFVSVTPGDETGRPSTSNLNLVAGNPPVPNKVDVKLDATGSIRVYNRAGQVFLIGDVVGYYTPAGGAGTPGPQGPVGPKGDTGPQGATGAQGVPGDPGAAGTDGTDGVDGDDATVALTYVSADFTTAGLRTTVSVPCPAGTVATSGAVSGPSPIFTEISRLVDTAGSGWEVRVNRGGAADKAFNVTAICVAGTATATVAP